MDIKEKLKTSLSLEEVYTFIEHFGGAPTLQDDKIVSKTICHHSEDELGDAKYKLFYYDNTKLFICYSECNEPFDIYELYIKIQKHKNKKISLPEAINYVNSFFGNKVEIQQTTKEEEDLLDDWKYLNANTKEEKKREETELKKYNDDPLKNYPKPVIVEWEKEGIKKEVLDKEGICYDPVNCAILIPHRDIDGNLIGIKSRSLIEQDVKKYGKYKPAVIQKQQYNYPTGYSLYNLNNSKDNIRLCKKAIIFEGEKSCLKYRSFYGDDEDISVACCGSNLTERQVNLLLSLGVNEIIIAFDKQFKKIDDVEFNKWTKKLEGFYEKYKGIVSVSFVFDTEDLLEYKQSPIDNGKENFEILFKERKML